MKLNDYYQYYLTLHEHPKTRLLHFIGQWVTIFFIIGKDLIFNSFLAGIEHFN